MSEWKIFEEILPEIGRVMQEDPARGFERFERCFTNGEEPLTPRDWYEVFKYLNVSKYRIKPRTVTRTVIYPEPLIKEPKRGDTYWTIHSHEYPISVQSLAWAGKPFDEWVFERGMCFATKEDAEAAFDALFGGLNDET